MNNIGYVAPHELTSLPQAKRSVARDDWAADVICCWLITIGVLLTMRQLFRFEHPFPIILLRSAVIVTSTTLVTRRWWHTVLFLTSVILLPGLILLATGQVFALLNFIIGLIDWWVNLFPVSSTYNTPSNIALVQWIIVTGVSLLVFVLVRCIRSFGVLVTLLTILLYVIVSNNYHENLFALAFLCAGAIPLLARSYHSTLFRKLDSVFVSRRRIMAAGMALCVLCALFARQIVPADTSDWKNPALADLLDRIKASQDSLGRQPFTLHSSGLQPNVDRLGGDIDLDHKLMLKVETDYPAPLKGRVYSNYNGKGWTADSDPEYPYNNENSDKMATALDLRIPRNLQGDNPLEDAMPAGATRVTLMMGGYSLYSSGRVFSIASINKAASFWFNPRSELFSLNRLPTRFTYLYHSLMLDRHARNLAARLDKIERQSARGNDWPYDANYDSITARYLQLPDNLPQSVFNKAREVVGKSTNSYTRMAALEKYLQTNFEYTLKPGDVPSDVDFVDYFLNSKRGYCVYFASAMAVMARTLGVPSRFVIGYGLVSENDNWSAYTDNAHAWVECYFRGVGWVTFDPTAGSGYTPAFKPVPTTQKPINPTEGTSETTNAGQFNEQTTTTTTTAPKRAETTTSPSTTASKPNTQSKQSTALWIGIVAGVLFVLLLSAAALRVLRQRRAYDLETVHQRFADNTTRADYYYADLLRQLRLLGFAPEVSETMRQHARRVRQAMDTDDDADPPKVGDQLALAFDTVMNWRYGEVAPTDEELGHITDTHSMLEQLVKKKLSALRYFLVRLLFAK